MMIGERDPVDFDDVLRGLLVFFVAVILLGGGFLFVMELARR